MFVPISNTPRDYAWGSTSAIAQLLGREASGKPEAELWLGAHPGSSAVILDPEQAGGARTLAEWIERDPEAALGPGCSRLPFLLKILAADSPLSLQAHPTPEQAATGFERENALGIALDAPNRNYRDSFHKPELIYALSERFEALCGFRPVGESLALVDELLGQDTGGPLERFRQRLAVPSDEPAVLRHVVGWLLVDGAEVTELIDAVVERAGTRSSARFHRELATVQPLARAYPGDPGIVLALLLNRVTLNRGEALYLPAGNIHAYLSGVGVELMTASDNVLRGGLTPKHVDVPELMTVLDFAPGAVPLLEPETAEAGVEVYRPDVPDFRLIHLVSSPMGKPVPVQNGPAIAICTAGAVSLSDNRSEVRLNRGEAVYIVPGSEPLHCRGEGTIFVAATALVG